MKLVFTISYRTYWGQELCIVGNDGVHQWTEKRPLVMSCSDGEHWHAMIEMPGDSDTLSYRYAVRHTDGYFLYEQGHERVLRLAGSSDIEIRDHWRDLTLDHTYGSKAFVGALFSREKKRVKLSARANVEFIINIPRVERGQGVAVVGNIPELGLWDMNHKLILDGGEYPVWRGSITLHASAESPTEFEYKYVIYDVSTGNVIDMEWGDNRRACNLPSRSRVMLCDVNFRYTQGSWRGAGVAVPIFSLRSQTDFGTGEFHDLKMLADWAAATGQKMIQTLPINDTTLLHTFKDSYPYNAVSVFALNPLYIHLDDCGDLNALGLKERYDARKQELNSLNITDYQTVVDEKWFFLRSMYPAVSKKVFASADYKRWYDDNKVWLAPYAVFSYLRDEYGTPDYRQWPKYKKYRPQDVETLCNPKNKDYDKIAIHFWVQYMLDRQLRDAVDYVHSRGVAIKGDIPIGISPNSVDAWMYPTLFNLQCSAGAPPDDFSISGQNWGFPTYNWDVMAKDNYAWWRRRFQVMSKYFDAYRIDHILGFFRIWEMPKSAVWGLTGCFSPALPYTIDELREKGIQLSEDRMLRPYIRPWFIQQMFGDRWMQVKETFFEDSGYEMLRFREQFDTQRKVEAYFKEHNLNDDESLYIRNCLYELHCEVLFVRDIHDPNRLHPRISMMQSRTYKELSDYDKWLLSQLYNDFFYHRHNDFWKQSAMRKLPTLVSSTDMLVCGEDLGMVPECVPDVMHALQILSLEIQRMPKNPRIEFGHPNDAPYLSVCTTGTHDTNPLRAWWEEDRGRTQRYYNYVMGWWGEAPEHCTPEIAEAIVKQHIYSPAMWVILPLQDWLAVNGRVRLQDPNAERINVPDNPDNFWCYRMHLTLEDLVADKEFTRQMYELIDIRR